MQPPSFLSFHLSLHFFLLFNTHFIHFFLATSPKISTIPSPAFLSPCPSPLSLLPLVAQGWSRVSCSSRSHHKLPVCMNDSALPAATWPTLKVPPLLCSSATSKVTGRQREAVGWWISNVEGGRERRREEKGNKMTQNLGELLPRADVRSFMQQRQRKKKGRGKFLIHICLSICSSFWPLLRVLGSKKGITLLSLLSFTGETSRVQSFKQTILCFIFRHSHIKPSLRSQEVLHAELKWVENCVESAADPQSLPEFNILISSVFSNFTDDGWLITYKKPRIRSRGCGSKS